MGRKRKNKIYFSMMTQHAIVAYNSLDPETDNVRRERIFNRFIYTALAKLAENLCNVYDTDYIDEQGMDLQMAVQSYLLEKFPKFNPTTGSKAFSYFTIVGRNFLIVRNKKGYEKRKKHAEVGAIDIQRNIPTEMHRADVVEEKKEFMDMFVEYWEQDDKLNELFNTPREIAIADSVIYFFKKRHLIEKYNKKYLYILIRERTGYRTQFITKVVNKIKAQYKEQYKTYTKSGYLLSNR